MGVPAARLCSIDQDRGLLEQRVLHPSFKAAGLDQTLRAQAARFKWDNPTPLTRMWCVWEVYGAVACGRPLELIFAPGEDERFIELMQDETPEAITQALTTFDLADAECHNENDAQIMIVAAVSRLEGGFHALNGTVLEQLRRWLGATAQRIVASRLDVEGRSLGVARLMHNVGWLLSDQGLYDLAMCMYNDSLAIKKATLGPRHPSVASTMHEIASVLQNKGQYDAALAQFEGVLEIEKEQLGPRHPSVASTMCAIAQVLQNKGHYDAALAQFEEVLEIFKEQLGAEHASVGITLYRTSLVLSDLRHFADALAHAEESLSILHGLLDEDHPLFGFAKLAEGRALLGLGQQAGAVAALRRSVAIRETALGQEHPDTADSLSWLAEALQDASEAERARAIRLKKLGRNHPLTFKSKAQVARLGRKL